MAIIRASWKGDGPHNAVNRLEVIDVRDSDELAAQWADFAHHDHYDIRRTFFDSVLAQYPRRSCEAHAYMAFDGEFVDSLPWVGNLDGVIGSLENLIRAE
jgi:hypothetical protein